MARRPPKQAKASVTEAPAAEQGFLGRWSRRKREARERTHLAKAAPALDAPVLPERGQPAVEKSDADMPPLESLGEHSDYSEFMSPRVSEQLRRAALRKLFHLPKFNVVDSLDDYADDYTVFTPLGDIVTAHQRYQEDLEQEKERKRRAEETGPADEQHEQAPAVARVEQREASARGQPRPHAKVDEAQADTREGQRDESADPRR